MKKMLFFLIIAAAINSSCLRNKKQSIPNGRSSLLWEISGNSLKRPSYLFGIVQISAKSFLDKRPGITEKFNVCKAVLTEAVIDSLYLKKMFASMTLSGTSLDKILSYQEYDSVRTALSSVGGGDIRDFKKLKPVVLESYLFSFLNSKAAFSPKIEKLGEYFETEGKRRGDEILGLESADYQIDNAINTPISDQKRHLLFVVKELEAAKKNMAQVYKLYDDEDLDGLYNVLMEGDKEYSRAEKNQRIKGRNLKWMEKIPAIIMTRQTFICVNVFNIAGPGGLIDLLRKKGYIVKPLAT